MESDSDNGRDEKLSKIRSKMGKDLRTLRNIDEKVKDISRRMSKPSKSSWKQIKPKKTAVELRNMESQLGGIYRRFELLISSQETVNVVELRHKINLINGLKPKLIQLVEALTTSSSVDDIGQSSRQFQALEINPTPNPNPNPNPNPFHEGNDLRFPRLYPAGEYDSVSICIPSDVHIAEDDNSLAAKMYRTHGEMVERQKSEPPPKFMDCRKLCEDALDHLKSNEGVDYDFVGFASILVPVFSTTYGYGLHLNFFARPKGAPSHSPAVLIFVEVANGSPQQIIRSLPVPDIPYSHGDEDKPSSHTVYHPDDEDCPFCEDAKDGSLSNNFCLP